MIERIKDFFRNLFNIKKQQCIEAPKELKEPLGNIEIQRDVSFRNQIRNYNEEEKRALKLQKDFRAGLIKEEDLSEEDFILLTNLYEDQIEQTKQSIQRYKKLIIYIKSKLAQSN